MAKRYDWVAIEIEYISTEISLKKLAEKHSVPMGTIQDKSKKNKWSEKREEFRCKTITKALQKVEKTTVERISTILRASDKLIDQIEEALKDSDSLTRIMTVDKKTGKISTKKTKMVNGKLAKELSEAIKNLKDVYKTAETETEGNELQINIAPVETDNHTPDVEGYEKYGG